MSDTLADVAACLPSDHQKPFFSNHRNVQIRSDFPYEFTSSSSTESESDDDDVAGINRRFTRSVSLQERPKIPHPVENKKGFSGSPESTLNWAVSGPSQTRSARATPFGRTEEDAWDFICAAAGEVAMMKMRMNNISNVNNVLTNKTNSLFGAPLPLGPPLAHHHHHSHCAIWRSEPELFLRQPQFRQRVAGATSFSGGVIGRRTGLSPSAWPSLPVENQRLPQLCNRFTVNPVLPGSAGLSGRGTTTLKRECAGTGVFLPRRYTTNPPEPKNKAARVAQSFNKSMDPIIAQAQPNINGGFSPHHEMLIARRNAVMLAQHRSNTHVGSPEKPLVQPEVVLPQEWTY